MCVCVAGKIGRMCRLDVEVDTTRKEIWCVTTIAIHSDENQKGIYKEYNYKSLEAAYNKFGALCKKYGID